MLGKMAGQKKISGVIGWVKERESELRKIFTWPRDFPVHSTYDDVLAKCDEQDLIKAIEGVIRKARAVEKSGDEPSRLVAQTQEGDNLVHRAVDGKVMRGTLKHAQEHQPPVHLVGLYECETGLLLAQIEVGSKENEITAGKVLLDPKYVKGCIITSDAMFSFREWCAKIHIYNGYYMTIIKNNNPAVHGELELFLRMTELIEMNGNTTKKCKRDMGG
jgi:hypothetical protein